MPTNYILNWRTHPTGIWNYGGTYATKKAAIENAKKQLSGRFEYRLECTGGGIVEEGSADGTEETK